jgi:glutamate/tyrosine decarboxylase-like PLP-dependent enzyme
MALDPTLEIIAPWQDPKFELTSREAAVDYARKQNIPIDQSKRKIYSRDRNLWHISHEGADLEDPANEPWNASDYAHHLSRRARGLPLWFSVAVHGTDAYTAAVEATLATARAGAHVVEQTPHTELLLEPELSVVLFRRIGWTATDYQRWSDEQLQTQQSFVVPTSWAGEPAARFCIVNPLTTVDDLQMIIDSMA